MKKRVDENKDDMRSEYDLSKLKLVGRGIYAERFRSGTNLVLLDADVRKAFPDDELINETLRAIAKAKGQGLRSRKTPPRKTTSRSRHAA